MHCRCHGVAKVEDLSCRHHQYSNPRPERHSCSLKLAVRRSLCEREGAGERDKNERSDPYRQNKSTISIPHTMHERAREAPNQTPSPPHNYPASGQQRERTQCCDTRRCLCCILSIYRRNVEVNTLWVQSCLLAFLGDLHSPPQGRHFLPAKQDPVPLRCLATPPPRGPCLPTPLPFSSATSSLISRQRRRR